MKTDSFQREIVKDGKYVVEEVKQTTYDITTLSGNGIITHVGGNGRFKFTIGKSTFISQFGGDNICIKDYSNSNTIPGEKEYYDHSSVTLDRDIKNEWSKLYIYHTDEDNYWKALN